MYSSRVRAPWLVITSLKLFRFHTIGQCRARTPDRMCRLNFVLQSFHHALDSHPSVSSCVRRTRRENGRQLQLHGERDGLDFSHTDDADSWIHSTDVHHVRSSFLESDFWTNQSLAQEVPQDRSDEFRRDATAQDTFLVQFQVCIYDHETLVSAPLTDDSLLVVPLSFRLLSTGARTSTSQGTGGSIILTTPRRPSGNRLKTCSNS